MMFTLLVFHDVLECRYPALNRRLPLPTQRKQTSRYVNSARDF